MVNIDRTTGQILDIFAIILFFLLLFEQNRKFQNKRNILFAGVFVLLISEMDLQFNLSSLVILPAVYYFVFRIKNLGFETNCLYLTKALFISVVSTNISGIIFLNIEDRIFENLNSIIFIIGNMISAVLCSRILKMVFHFISKLSKNNIDSWSKRLTVYVSLIDLIILIMILTSTRIMHLQTKVLVNLLIFYSCVVLILTIVMAVLISLRISKFELEREKERIKDTSIYIEELESNYSELMRFKHDYRNLLLSIISMADSADNVKIGTTLRDILNEDSINSKTNKCLGLKNIQDSGTKGLILNKVLEAKKNNVMVNIEVSELIPDLKKNSFLVNRIIGILLDNAIEAAGDSIERKVEIAVIRKSENFEFVLRNTYCENEEINLSQIYEKNYSTKGANRGYGLSTVHQIVDKSDNIFINTSIDGHTFGTNLIWIDIFK